MSALTKQSHTGWFTVTSLFSPHYGGQNSRMSPKGLNQGGEGWREYLFLCLFQGAHGPSSIFKASSQTSLWIPLPSHFLFCHDLPLPLAHKDSVLCCAQSLSSLWLFVTPCTVHGPPGSSIHGSLQARIMEWVAMTSSRGSSQPRDQTQVSHIADRFFTVWATREAIRTLTMAFGIHPDKPG